ncbi:MAG: pseudouridine synthase, partial [Bacteroidota bacterium]
YDNSSLIGYFKDQYSWLAPINRIDKPASGLVIFAKSADSYRHHHLQLKEPNAKSYLAIVRGYVNWPLCCFGKTPDESGKIHRDSKSVIKPIQNTECEWSVGKYPTSRYSLIKVSPLTGRWHQIRIHLAQMRHPIIGDHRHGDVKHNRFFKQQLFPHALLLHAWTYRLTSREGENLELTSLLPSHWSEVMKFMGLDEQAGPDIW